MRTPENCKNNKTRTLQYTLWALQREFHTELCARLREVRWRQHQEEQRYLVQLEDQYFGNYKDPWFEGVNLPGFQSIAKIILTEE